MKTLFATITATTIAIVTLSSAVIAQEIPKTLKQGMSYAQARKALINAGWQAVELSPNRDRFGAMNYIIKLGYNEVESCSGTGMGFCRFNFTDADGRKLAVVTINNQQGQHPKLHRWWIDTEQ
ncbi:MAG: hypothetical protein NW224_30445 [Leptolyngbyaceae cyanobacterium bins.302]|nr:hypothetical protein [Leptolyngbyaceae cyanobacterium bins.302]